MFFIAALLAVHIYACLSFFPFSFFMATRVLVKPSTGESRFYRNYSNVSILL